MIELFLYLSIVVFLNHTSGFGDKSIGLTLRTGHFGMIIALSGIFYSLISLIKGYLNLTLPLELNRTFVSEIVAGITLFLTSMIFLCHIKKSGKIILYTAIVFCLFYLLHLRTRAGYAAVVAGLAVLGIIIYSLHKKRIISRDNDIKKKSLILSCIFFLVVIAAVLIPSDVKDRSSLSETVSSVFNKDYHSNKLRLIYWEASLKMFADHPLTGIAGGQWPGMFLKYRGDIFNDENKSMNLSYSAHNDYFEMLAEYGIWGILYSIFIFTGIYFLFKVTVKDINYLPYLITAVGFSVTSFFNFTHENIWAISFFILCLGMGYGKYLTFKYRKVENIITFIYNKPKVKYLLYTVVIILFAGFITLKIYHYSVEKRYVAAINLKMQGNYKEMISELDKIPEWIYPVDMNKMPVSFYRGAGNFELGNYDEAMSDFRKARTYSRYYPLIMMNEASALYATGNNNEAIGLLKEMKELFPNFIEPQINLLSVYANLKMDNEIKELIREIDNRKFDSKYVKNYGVFVQIKNYFR